MDLITCSCSTNVCRIGDPLNMGATTWDRENGGLAEHHMYKSTCARARRRFCLQRRTRRGQLDGLGAAKAQKPRIRVKWCGVQPHLRKVVPSRFVHWGPKMRVVSPLQTPPPPPLTDRRSRLSICQSVFADMFRSADGDGHTIPGVIRM